MRELDPKRGFFPIGVAAEILGVEPRVLRIYEKKGLVQPSRSEGNRRLYSLKDLELLEYVHYVTHVRKVNLAGVKVILELLEKLPADIRRGEMSFVEHAVDRLDETTRKIFAQGSEVVERSLLDEQSAGDLQREVESEMASAAGSEAAPDTSANVVSMTSKKKSST